MPPAPRLPGAMAYDTCITPHVVDSASIGEDIDQEVLTNRQTRKGHRRTPSI
jgi:hypothetical protein